MPLDNLQLRNSLFVCEKGAELQYAKNILFDNVKIVNTQGDRLVKNHVENLTEK